MTTSALKTYRFKAGFGEAEVLHMRESLAMQMQEAGVLRDSGYALVNVLDEFCCNMMEHSDASWIEIMVDPRPTGITAMLRDDGQPFDPTLAIGSMDPEQPAHVTDRRLGLYMIGLLAKDLKYSRLGNVNQLEFSLKR
jgi:anti-sigma regulatory factor (Ser/Thr protein kinase)